MNGFFQPQPEQPIHPHALVQYPSVSRPWTNNSLSTSEFSAIVERIYRAIAAAASPEVTGRSARHQYIYDNSRLATLDDLLGTPPRVRPETPPRYQGARPFSFGADVATANQQTPTLFSNSESPVVAERSSPQDGGNSRSMHFRRRQMTMNIPPSGPRRRADGSVFATATAPVSSQPSPEQLISPPQQSPPQFSLTQHAVEVMSQLQDRQQRIEPQSPPIDGPTFNPQNNHPHPNKSPALSLPAISAQTRMMSALQSLNSRQNKSESRDSIAINSKPNTKIDTHTTDTPQQEPIRFQSWLDRQPPISNLRSTSTSTRPTRSSAHQIMEHSYASDTEEHENNNIAQYRNFSEYEMPDLWDHMRRSGYQDDSDRRAR
ncbi:hypothetical protein OCU04_012877 [Sclerotinia nivalis]|uniref:Uncharacterized protein n=1 Tax=Sclerotinia nivalis TaxID=352851 RepID=A0A9X0A9F7_9HELO|nr:hypothetical protein OCU04_012877 [Sclerotinia nivalis]